MSDTAADLIHALIDNLRVAREGWTSLAIVVNLDASRVSGTHGYVYAPDGTPSAVAARPSGITPAVAAFLNSRYPADQARPVKFLVQFDRASGGYEVTFEDDDPSRWRVTPANIRRIGEELRPNLA